jgi:translocator protein
MSTGIDNAWLFGDTRYGVKITKFIVSIALCFIVAFLGSIITFPSIPAWYVHLNKPFFNPPNWIFGPVWTILYILMGISLYIVWTKNAGDKKKENAIKIFILQLVLNLLWSLVFFGLHQPLVALIIIIILWLSIFKTIKYFSKLSKLSAQLLYPYIFWVSFASVLNFSIVILNK